MKVKIDFYLKDGREVSTFETYDGEGGTTALHRIAMNIENTLSKKVEINSEELSCHKDKKVREQRKYFMGHSKYEGAVIMVPMDNISYFVVNELIESVGEKLLNTNPNS